MENLTSNNTLNNISGTYTPVFEKYELLFWIWSSLYLCLAMIAVIGNGMVLYAALKTKNLGRLRFFDGTIKSLAATDLLIGLIGIPGRIISLYYMGKYNLKLNAVKYDQC